MNKKMLQFLSHIDQRLFFFLNGMHNPFFDTVMYQVTGSLWWVPLYLLFLYLVIREYKWQTFIVIAFAAALILVSDQTVHRLRPSNDPALTVVHIVNGYRGGAYGFYSAHASNTFAIAVYLIVLIGRRFRYMIIPLLTWACIMSYTRIYLGVHYPGDIICGGIAGAIIGFGLGKLCLRMILVLSKPDGFSSPLRR
jgi:undecaprenyl-diphosphatase